MTKTTHSYFVADIGGTNARLAIASTLDNEKHFVLKHTKQYLCSDFDNFTDLLHEYYSEIQHLPPFGCIAVAGPVHDGKVSMTNLNWQLDEKDIENAFPFQTFKIINDFESLSMSLDCLPDTALLTVKQSTPSSTRVRAVIGAGTGLGVAALLSSQDNTYSLPSEGGHVEISPRTNREHAVVDVLREKHGYVSAEDLLSGMGIGNIYQSLQLLDQISTPFNTSSQSILPAEISERAIKNSDPLAVETMTIFFALLGSLCGNVVLTYGAKGGLYLGGGILPKVFPLLDGSDFLTRFHEKGKMSHYLEDVPIYLIQHPYPSLIGAAAHLSNLRSLQNSESTPAHQTQRAKPTQNA